MRASASGEGSESGDGAKLVLYTKPGCCLCDGLKETLDEVMSGNAEVPTLAATLKTLTLETRDVSTNPAWAEAYAMEVPVLTLVTERPTGSSSSSGGGGGGCGGTSGDEGAGEGNEVEIQLPRPAPRLSPARLAVRLSQDVKAAMAGESGTRKGWTATSGGGGEVGDDETGSTSTEEKPKKQQGGGGGGWAVVSENPF